jgi:hypothetical protein
MSSNLIAKAFTVKEIKGRSHPEYTIDEKLSQFTGVPLMR